MNDERLKAVLSSIGGQRFPRQGGTYSGGRGGAGGAVAPAGKTNRGENKTSD